jgi:hypothetical protein
MMGMGSAQGSSAAQDERSLQFDEGNAYLALTLVSFRARIALGSCYVPAERELPQRHL